MDGNRKQKHECCVKVESPTDKTSLLLQYLKNRNQIEACIYIHSVRYVMNKHSPWYDDVNAAVTARMTYMQQTERAFSLSLHLSGECREHLFATSTQSTASMTYSPLAAHELAGVFIVHTCLLCFAALVFCAELLVHKFFPSDHLPDVSFYNGMHSHSVFITFHTLNTFCVISSILPTGVDLYRDGNAAGTFGCSRIFGQMACRKIYSFSFFEAYLTFEF